MTTRITVDVYDRTWSHVTALPQSAARRWRDPLNDTGDGQLIIQNDDAAFGSVVYGQVLRFAVDGTPRFAALIENISKVSVAPGEEVDEATTLAGRGVLAVWEDAVVLPDLGVDQPVDFDTRSFNFASPDLIDSGWGTPVSGSLPSPEGWLDQSALWIWSQDPMTLPVPAGDVYFRKQFTTAVQKSVDVWCVADDGYEIWLDGRKLFEDTLVGGWTGIPKHQKLSLPAGTHTVAVHARNNNALLAGMRASVIEIDSYGTMIASLASSDLTWKVLAYPAAPPGFTPGKILRLLLAEAQARGALPGMTLGFTDTNDSAGVAWPSTPDVTVQVGADLLSVLKQLCETYMDVKASPTAWRLDAYVARGTTPGVALSAGANLTELHHNGKA